MDWLERPEVKNTYDKCKYTVKLWEHNFKKSKGRLPSKLDIREADKSVRDAYRKYYQLKTAALEQSFKGVDGFHSDNENTDDNPTETWLNERTRADVSSEEIDGVWGDHLNKKTEQPQNLPKTKLNTSVGKKIFVGSKLSKRYSRKSTSFSQKKTEPSFDSGILTHPTKLVDSEPEQEAPLSFEGMFTNLNVVSSKMMDTLTTQPINIVQSVLDNTYKTLKNVDSGWLERVGKNTGLEIEPSVDSSEDLQDMCLNYNSDDFIASSDEETSINAEHQRKKAKIDIAQRDNNKCSLNPFEFEDEYQEPKPSKKRNTKTITEKRKTHKTKATEETTPSHVRKSCRSTKTKTVMIESHSEDEDPFHSDNDSKDPEFTVNENKKKLLQLVAGDEDIPSVKMQTNKGKRKLKSKAIQSQEETKTDQASYELEYSIKPRVAAPRFKNLKKLIKIETSSATDAKDDDVKENIPEVKSKRQQDLNKLEKRIQSGNLNENFVTINLKKKVYSRGKKNMNFSKFKKQLWKNKKKALAGPDMDMGGCDGGSLTCFNCGQTGHFARNCPNTKGDGLLPLVADKEVCPFPTLEEASQLAKDSALAIRKPNLDINTDNVETKGESSEINTAEDSDHDDLFDDVDTEKLLAEVLKLEEHVAKLDLQRYMDHVTVVDPFYQTNDDGSIMETPKEVFDVLQKFGHTSFRPGQEMAIMRILSGKSTLVTLSTGSGKSLCYQLPAYLFSRREPCISLIVSPLVSLMEDQVTGIPGFLKAACLHTNQTKIQRDKIMEAISSGLLNVLLVSPEAVVAGEKSSAFGSLIRRLPPIAFACIDEAHCVSQWSHNFRPSYLMICRVLREKMGVKTVLGLTATATRATCDSIITHLQIPDGRNGIISDVPLPDNLVLTVSKDYQRDQALLALLTSARFKDCKSVIVYCTRREECNRITKFLRTSLQYEAIESKKRKRVNYQAEPYHAGLSASRRRTIQNAFMSGELRIVVATVAFGMGINKSDIRSVIHYNMPKNFESYVQEIGRAGRDGLPAHCHLFLDAKGKDENELRRHIYANSIDRHVIRKLLQKIFLPCACKDFCPKHEVAFCIEESVRELDIPEENISTLLCYLELHEKKYIETLSPAYTHCKIISYGGPLQIRKAAKECPPLAMALALQKNPESDANVLEFAVVDIAAAIGWDSGICKHKLKNLEWTSEHGLPKRSLLNVTFSKLGFRLLAPGNLDDDQLDEALDNLYEHVVVQEKTALLQLHAVHETLVEVAASTYRSCLSEETSDDNSKLKSKIRQYFESPNPLDGMVLTENHLVDENQIINDIRCLINMYRDNNFTGRAIARIFHGITSPNYPAVIWGRCKYWRSHINVDFHTICKLALKEILYFR